MARQHSIELCIGDRVQLRGQEGTGEVVRLQGVRAVVAFGALQVSVPCSQLRRAAAEAPRTTLQQPAVRVLNVPSDAFLRFDTTLDLHGLDPAAALDKLDRWIDQGALLGHKYLKIIHGKGAGILRRTVRAHVQVHSQVARVVDRHAYRGGDGVTCIELH